MRSLQAAALVSGLLLLLGLDQGFESKTPNVTCRIYNMEDVFCSWRQPASSETNYTLCSTFQRLSEGECGHSFDECGRSMPCTECPQYLQQLDGSMSCRFPLRDQDQRFHPLHTKLSIGRNRTVNQTHRELQLTVKLAPPRNLSVVWQSSRRELWLYWNHSVPAEKTIDSCLVTQVSYHKDSLNHWQHSTNMSGTSFSLPLASPQAQYVLRVRSGVQTLCGASMYWSDWSTELCWGNKTGGTPKRSSSGGWKHALVSILGVILLIVLVLLLCYSERIKVILLPVVPQPSKNLQELFNMYSGSSESWAHISKDLKEAFEPEPTCIVCEDGVCSALECVKPPPPGAGCQGSTDTTV